MIQPFLAFLFQGDSSTAPGGAPAGGPGGGPPPQTLGDSLMGLAVPMLLCIVVFWVFMIGPERKQRKKREEMLKSLKKGDEVVTTGGLYGSIVQVQDGIVTLQVADGVRMRFAVASIGSVTSTEAAAKS